MVADDYDLVIALSGTVPHEALGYSGGTKILFPGISGPEVIALLHWAAVLMGIPRLIGTLDNPAREVVDAGARFIFDLVRRPMLALNMVYTEDEHHRAVPRGLFAGWGPAGFADALRRAAELSSRLHVHLPRRAGERSPSSASRRCTTRCGRPARGRTSSSGPASWPTGGEIVLFAPHIHQFHSDPELDAAIRAIGYHGLDYVVDYLRRNPGFNRNVAAHVINVRGHRRVARRRRAVRLPRHLASQISERDCEAVGLGYRDPASAAAGRLSGRGTVCGSTRADSGCTPRRVRGCDPSAGPRSGRDEDIALRLAAGATGVASTGAVTLPAAIRRERAALLSPKERPCSAPH